MTIRKSSWHYRLLLWWGGPARLFGINAVTYWLRLALLLLVLPTLGPPVFLLYWAVRWLNNLHDVLAARLSRMEVHYV